MRDTLRVPWPLWPFFDAEEESALLGVLHSGKWWCVEGTESRQFEEEFAVFQGASYAVACTNGTAALEIALRALDIGCGDEVIVPAYSFIATASSVLGVGAAPLFVDIQPDTLNIDPTLIASAVTPRTRAVIVVHMAGRPADMDAILEVAARHNLLVIEDAAQAHGSEWRGRRVGALGHLGTFSFQASKNLNAGEGGIVVTDDEVLGEAAWSVANVGRVRKGRRYEHSVYGSNFRMTEFQSAILRTQLKRLPGQSARRTANAAVLRELLQGIPGIALPSLDPRITAHAYHLFTFRYDPEAFGGRSYVDFIAALGAEGIPCSDGYVPLYKEGMFYRTPGRKSAFCQAGRRIDYAKMHLPVCEQVCQDTVWLPQNLLLAERSDMETIAAAILKIQQSAAA